MNKLFVYGTLKPGQRLWPQLLPYATDANETTTPGTLYDPGWGWPAATFPGPNQSPGWTVELNPNLITQALAVLDKIEGVDHGLFQRITINIDGQPCWAYHWPDTVDTFTKIEEWI